MARPRSDDKRAAILAAASTLFAERGLGATPTSAISKAAGIAEGTLFTYFPTKDALINTLYREIKQEMAQVLLAGFRYPLELQPVLRQVWDTYVGWGVQHPAKIKVMGQLKASDRLTGATLAAGYEPFAELEELLHRSIAEGALRPLSVPYIAAILSALAETTMQFMVQAPDKAQAHRDAGFEVFWCGVSA